VDGPTTVDSLRADDSSKSTGLLGKRLQTTLGKRLQTTLD